jgi:hypothetical protein
MGDGATVKIMPMVNMLCAGVHEPAGCLEIADCTGHLEDCGKKYSRYIADQFKPHMAELYPNGYLIDCIFFYGASNVQKAGRILQVMYPCTTVVHGYEHVVSLFFKDLSKLPQVQDQILRHHFIYRVLGSGSMNLPYKLFHKQTWQFNNGRDIGLLRASDASMASYFMDMHRDLLLKMPLQATVSIVGFLTAIQIKNQRIQAIQSKMEWNGSVCFISSVLLILLFLYFVLQTAIHQGWTSCIILCDALWSPSKNKHQI